MKQIKYYEINEDLAKRAKESYSFSDYEKNSATEEYKSSVDEAYALAEKQKDKEQAYYLADRYAHKLAGWTNKYNQNTASCPSVMITGPANFPTTKKNKQSEREERLWEEYKKIKNYLNKIENVDNKRVEKQGTASKEDFTNEFCEVIQNEEANRIQLKFDGKPSIEQIEILKKKAWRWSPKNKVWQRQMTSNGFYSLESVLEAFENLEGGK